MCISKPNVSTPQVQAAPQVSDSAVQDAADSDRRRRAAAGGQKSTILTSSQGVTQSSSGSQGKTLLGA